MAVLIQAVRRWNLTQRGCGEKYPWVWTLVRINAEGFFPFFSHSHIWGRIWNENRSQHRSFLHWKLYNLNWGKKSVFSASYCTPTYPDLLTLSRIRLIYFFKSINSIKKHPKLWNQDTVLTTRMTNGFKCRMNVNLTARSFSHTKTNYFLKCTYAHVWFITLMSCNIELEFLIVIGGD